MKRCPECREELELIRLRFAQISELQAQKIAKLQDQIFQIRKILSQAYVNLCAVTQDKGGAN